jgi:hypothetical protein
MSSESSDRKIEAADGPGSRPSSRPSGRAPSAWGAARDALAAVHNLEALLRSNRVTSRIIRELVPELREGAGVLRAAFEEARAGGSADTAVGEYGSGRVDALERLLDEAEAATRGRDDRREELAARAAVLEEELEAAADLLALLERAASPSPTEVSVDLVVRETGRLWGSGRGRELAVRFDEAWPDHAVTTDPYVVGPLLALLVAWVHAAGAKTVVVRARFDAHQAIFHVEAAGAQDGARPLIPMRVMPRVPPTEHVARRVAEQIGASVELEGESGSLVIPLAAG